MNKFIMKYKETGSVERKAGAGRPTRMIAAVQTSWNSKRERMMKPPPFSFMPSLHTMATNDSEDCALMSLFAGLDLLGQCLLPTNSTSKQGEASSVGTAAPEY